MNSCKYSKDNVINGIVHEFCSNEYMKEINNSKDKDIPCILRQGCVKFEPNNNEENEVQE